MLVSELKHFEAVVKSEDRCSISIVASILGLIHGLSLIHIIHGPWKMRKAQASLLKLELRLLSEAYFTGL